MATIYEVSKLAGVSLATVSRVMNGSANVNAKTEAKVKKAMKSLGYVPNSVAISLASKRSNCIGILVAEFDGVFFGSMMQGIEKELRAFRKHVVITAGHSNAEHEKKGIEFLKSRNCDALIVHVEQLSDEFLIELSKGKTPVYVINRYVSEIADKCITLDNFYGGYLATKYVLDKGHRELVNICGPKFKMDAVQRVEGYKKALEEHSLQFVDKHVVEGDYLQETGAAAIDFYMANDIPFSAVVCGNDQMAIGAMARLREHNKIPPHNVSIIGFDDVTFAACTFPTLTTVKYPISEMGKVAARTVLKDVYKLGIENTSRVFEPTLIERDSVIQFQDMR